VPAVAVTSGGAAGAAPVRPSSSPARALGDLLSAVPSLTVPDAGPTVVGVAVTGCTHDSRAVRPGDLYAALPGARAHGADFVADVVAAGAAAVLTDPAGAERAVAAGLPVLVAPDARAVLGEVARCVYGDPAAGMLVIGVTGTNGKTTTSFLLEAGMRAAGHRTGLLGTVLTRIGDDVVPSVRTTPEATDLQALLAVMRERGTTAVAMEVSSHALALGRVDGLVFDIAVFTNLSQDHLDFHASMAEYEAVKASLFAPSRARAGVVCVDDAAGRRVAARAQVPVVTVSTTDESGDWTARDVDLRAAGSTFRLRHAGGEIDVCVPLPGGFNVANAAVALAALHRSGVDIDAAAAGVAALDGVPGRMERVDAGQPFAALVDYAHTPEAVTTLLAAVRRVTTGKVIVVLGCGGDRDAAKRPLMARAAVTGADVAILTSDNPRSEDPLEILRQMATGAPGDAVVESDRRAAIRLAVRQARPGDAVVVAGKGHETGQEVDGVVTPFDDRVVLREALQQVRA
jgi:UDP-N-acetylmuramoyl-L-alanyl-D-glutamate--2,6-diaminopimelate ligase